MKKVKSILFRANFEGRGIVNFDDDSQKWLLHGSNLKHLFDRHNNAKYAKSNIYGDLETKENLVRKIKISSQSLKYDMFDEDLISQNPSIVHNKDLLYSYITSPMSLLRGYVFLSRNESSIKKKGAITITDAEQTCDAISKLEFNSRSGQKEENDDVNDTTIRKEETVGDIKYTSSGVLDIMGLSFISCDQLFDRYSFNPDDYELYKKYLDINFPSDHEFGYFRYNTSKDKTPEQGVLLCNQQINELVQMFLSRLMNIHIKRAGSYAKIDSLQIKYVYDPIEDNMNSEDGWIDITSKECINSLSFEAESFYTKVNDSDAQELRKSMVDSDTKEKNSRRKGKAKK